MLSIDFIFTGMVNVISTIMISISAVNDAHHSTRAKLSRKRVNIFICPFLVVPLGFQRKGRFTAVGLSIANLCLHIKISPCSCFVPCLDCDAPDRPFWKTSQVENNFCHFLLGDPGVGVGNGKISPELVFKLEFQRPIVQNSHPTDINDTSHNTIHTQIANTNSQTPNT